MRGFGTDYTLLSDDDLARSSDTVLQVCMITGDRRPADCAQRTERTFCEERQAARLGYLIGIDGSGDDSTRAISRQGYIEGSGINATIVTFVGIQRFRTKTAYMTRLPWCSGRSPRSARRCSVIVHGSNLASVCAWG